MSSIRIAEAAAAIHYIDSLKYDSYEQDYARSFLAWLQIPSDARARRLEFFSGYPSAGRQREIRIRLRGLFATTLTEALLAAEDKDFLELLERAREWE